jgi:hypothetical protein
MVTTLLSWVRVRRWAEGLGLAVAVALTGCFGSTTVAVAASTDKVRPQPTRIELGQSLPAERDVVKLLFSTNGQMIYAWWHDWRVVAADHGYIRQPDEFRVFSLSGRQLCSSRDTNHSLVWSNFPSVAWRDTQATFVTDAVGWIFDPAYAWGVRVFKMSTLWNVRIECWSLPQASGAAPLWSREIEKAFSCRPIAAVGSRGEELLFTMQRAKAMILSWRTGETIREFTLGHVETAQEAAGRKRKFGLEFERDDPSLYFSPHVFSYDAERRLLACGASYDKRVRVVDIGPPVRVVFEANTDANPGKPHGGTWNVSRVDFVAGGKYLIVAYDFGGRLTSLSIDSTEILDTRTWNPVWKEDDRRIGSVTLSPDASLLAYVRDKVLEIIPFQPGR